jgi:hypothetical protein
VLILKIKNIILIYFNTKNILKITITTLSNRQKLIDRQQVELKFLTYFPNQNPK